MGRTTKIEWADATWSPISGCVKVSQGCKFCYAEAIAKRFAGGPAYPLGFTPTVHHDRLDEPLRWRKPRGRVFVCSMADLFQDAVSDETITTIWSVMEQSTENTFLVLTKRAERMEAFVQDLLGGDDPPPNIWRGVSVEDQENADPRILCLLRTKAAVRFVSFEPLLGPIVLPQQNPDGFWPPEAPQPAIPFLRHKDWPDDFGYWNTGIDWMIVGGETGPKARHMNHEWALNLLRQARAANVPFFMKQMSRRDPIPLILNVREFPECG